MKSITLENISKSYQKSEFAVKNVNFKAEEGEFVILVGPSGCGKSTILKMIAGLEEITEGKLYFDDRLMNSATPAERNIGMVFQNYALYPHLNVFDNIAFPLSIKKTAKNIIREKVTATAKMLGLEDYLDKKPKHLSGGQRQRVALGRAIVREPDVFLFDEPLSNLDAKLRVQMRTEIVNLHRKFGATSIYVTHDQTEAMTMGDKLIVMNDGEIMQVGTPKEIYEAPQNIFTASFLGNPQINLFDGTVTGNVFKFNAADTGIQLPEKVTSSDYSGKATLGIRPEFLQTTTSDENSIATKIINIEYLGHEKLLYFDFGGLKCLRQNADSAYSVGDNIRISPDRNKIILFDQNGNRL